METNVEGQSVSPNDAKPMLPAVLFAGAKIYRTNYNDITDVITIERVTKTQAISKNNTYKFAIEVSSHGTVKKIGNTDRWSTSSYYLETPALIEKLWKQNAIIKLKETNFSKLSIEKLKQLVAVLNGR